MTRKVGHSNHHLMLKSLILAISTITVLSSKFEVMGGDRPIKVNMIVKDKTEAVMLYQPNNTFQFLKNDTVLAEAKNGSLEWMVHANLNFLKIKGGTIFRTTIGNQTKQIRNFQLVSLDNFASGEKYGWQGADMNVKECGPSKDKSLFRNCMTKTHFVEKKFTSLSNHTEVMIELMFHFIDKWEGELAYVMIESDVVWTKSHNWCHTIFNHKCMLNGINVCDNAYPDTVGQSVKFVYKHNKPEIIVRIGSTLAKGNCQANWGFNNFMLYIR